MATTQTRIPPTIYERRSASKLELQIQLAKILAPLQEQGFYGRVPLDLELRDGVVELLTNKGAEQKIKLVP